MNQDDIIRMALKAGFNPVTFMGAGFELFERFAALVAAAEREACAQLCDDLDEGIPDGLAGWQFGEAIQARGNK